MNVAEIWSDIFFVRLCGELQLKISTFTAPFIEASKIYKPLEDLAVAIDRPPGEVMCAALGFILFFSCIPMPWIRNTKVRKIYASILGLSTAFYAYGAAFWIYIV